MSNQLLVSCQPSNDDIPTARRAIKSFGESRTLFIKRVLAAGGKVGVDLGRIEELTNERYDIIIRTGGTYEDDV